MKSITTFTLKLPNYKLVLCFIFFCLSTSAFAQNQAKVDSLSNLLESSTSEQEQVDLLNQLALEYVYIKPDKADNYSTKAKELATKISYAKGLIGCHKAFGATKMVYGKYSESVEEFKNALQIAQAENLKVDEAKLLNNIGVITHRMGNSTEALTYHRQALKTRKEIGDQGEVIVSYNNIGLVHLETANYDSALNYFIKAESLKEYYSQAQLATLYNNFGLVYHNKGDFPKALDYHLQSLKISEEIGHKWNMARSYSNVALVYEVQESHTEAIENHYKSLAIEKEIGNKLGVARSYGSIGMVYDNMGDYDKALEHHFIALKELTSLEEPKDLILTYGNIGETYLNKKNYPKATTYLEKGLKLSQDANLKDLEIASLGRLAQVYFDLKNYKQAKQHTIKSLSLAKALGLSIQIRNGSKLLADIEEKLGNHSNALAAYQMFHQYYDSLLGAEKSQQLSELKVQYETEKKEQEIKSLNQETAIQALELQQTNLKFTILGIASILLLLAAAIIYLVNRQKQLALKQKAQNVEQKLLRVQMNPHFIFNAMTSIQDYMVQGDTEEASSYLSKFSRLMRQVLDDSRSDFISLDQEVRMLENYLSLQNLRRDIPFNYQIDVDEEIMSEEIAIPPMFAQPFVENAIEHGIASLKENATIHIQFSLENNFLVLKVKDNGKGIEGTSKVKQKDHVSHAVNITKERIDLYRQMSKKQIAFHIQNLSPGTQVTFNLPFQYV